jgi:glutathione S-transferase
VSGGGSAWATVRQRRSQLSADPFDGASYGQERAMIKLHQFAPAWEVQNLSPFCLKVETYLRMAGLAFEVVHAIPPQAPKRQLPFIEDDGQRIADSQFIIEYLKRTYGDTLDGHLSPPERAVSNAMQRLVENHLCWAFMFARFGKRDANWSENKRALFGPLPPVVRNLVPPVVRRQMLRELRGHGMGRHTEAEIYQLGQRDLESLRDFLAEKTWFMGELPTTLDASAFGLLANVLWVPIESPLKECLKALPTLTSFCTRVRDRYFSAGANRVA